MNQSLRKAIDEVFEELRAMPEAEFRALLGQHKYGPVSYAMNPDLCTCNGRGDRWCGVHNPDAPKEPAHD